MNFQTFLDPIHSAFMWTFDLLEAGGDMVNNALILVVAGLMLFWVTQLIKFNKDEVPNR